MAYNAVTVTDTATLIIAASPRRQSHLIMNNDALITVYVGPDTAITDLTAFPLGPGNQLLEDKSKAGFHMGDIYGICAAAESTEVRYWTRVKDV